VSVANAGMRSCNPPVGDKRRCGNGSPNRPQPLRFDPGGAAGAGLGTDGGVVSSASGT